MFFGLGARSTVLVACLPHRLVTGGLAPGGSGTYSHCQFKCQAPRLGLLDILEGCGVWQKRGRGMCLPWDLTPWFGYELWIVPKFMVFLRSYAMVDNLELDSFVLILLSLRSIRIRVNSARRRSRPASDLGPLAKSARWRSRPVGEVGPLAKSARRSANYFWNGKQTRDISLSIQPSLWIPTTLRYSPLLPVMKGGRVVH